MQLLDNCDLIIVAFSFSTFSIVFCSNSVTSPLVTNSLIFLAFLFALLSGKRRARYL